MRNEWLNWSIVIILVLAAGWLMGYVFQAEENYASEEVAAFRTWFWERRTLDLLAQVGLIFGGALGVAALLPGHREMREIHAQREIRAQSEEPHAPLA